MVPTRYDYYKARSREHRRLAGKAPCEQDRIMHERLVDAYAKLARENFLCQVVTLRASGPLAS